MLAGLDVHVAKPVEAGELVAWLSADWPGEIKITRNQPTDTFATHVRGCNVCPQPRRNDQQISSTGVAATRLVTLGRACGVCVDQVFGRRDIIQ